jgi:hypothetical protein
MTPIFSDIVKTIEPLMHPTYGNRYRCALTLKDGTFLPCAVVLSKSSRVELAKRRINEVLNGQGKIGGQDPLGQIVETFVASGNRVADYDVKSATESKHAIPISLLSKIEGETTMGWTGWVFEMDDGKLFAYGSPFSKEFFDLPSGYQFEDVQIVHNHSYLNSAGEIRSLRRGGLPPEDYDPNAVYREKVYFECYVEGL